MHLDRLIQRPLLLGLTAALALACAEAPPEPDEALDDEAEEEDIDPTFFRGEGLFSLKANVRTVGELSRSGACSTAATEPLTLQIAEELACMRPGAFVRIDGTPNVQFSAAAMPFLQPNAARSLTQAARSRTVVLNSTWRSVAQQYLLKSWEGRCGIRIAASPGRSNHESGLAIDVDNYATQAVRSALRDGGMTWYCSETNGGRTSGCGDPVHFTNYTGQDMRSQGVLAFQRLWNRNNPNDRISEDGAWGPQTSERMRRAPLAGFARGATCGGSQNEPAPPPANPCGNITVAGSCEGDTVARCVDGRVIRTDCAGLGRFCGLDANGALCVQPNQPEPPPPAADPCSDMPVLGRCEGAVALWCDGGQLKRHDCSVSGQGCGYVDDSLGYYCVAAGQPPVEQPPVEEPPPPAVPVDPGYQADGECTPMALADYSPPDTGGPNGESISRCVSRISRGGMNTMDCRYPGGEATWYVTSFGGGADTQSTSCGGRRADGQWYYAANAQRFGCGARFQLWNDRGCVVVETADSGAHVCVEEAAGGPIFDVSPLATRILTGYSSAGWSERIEVKARPVAAGTPLGACR